MLILDAKNIEREGVLDLSWNERDFVAMSQEFIRSKINKVLIVSGLRGTGKTTGMLQLVRNNDGLYLSSERGESETAQDYIDLIKNSPQKVIVIDEYTWIKDRDRLCLDSIVSSCVQHGKRIILTGTESASLEALRHKDLIHRAECLHVTRFSFDEFKRLNSSRLPKQPKKLYDMFLQEGGIFQGYVNHTAKGMDDYIRNSIIENLYSYIGAGNNLSRSEIAAVVYTVLYDAVHDVMSEKLPGEQFSVKALEELSYLGIEDVKAPVNPLTVRSVGEILTSIGVLIKVPNIIERENRDDDFRFYIVNPAITWNLAKMIYDPIKDKNRILGKLLEASVIVELEYSKLDDDDLYFYENPNGEVDAVIAPSSGESDISLFEVRHRYKINSHDIQNKQWTVLTGKAGYFVYTGSSACLGRKDKDGQKDK